MGVTTKIEWCHHTFNPWWGCEKVSPGCAHCYAEAFAKRTGHPVWGGGSPRRFFGDKHWAEPLKWNRDAEKSGERRRVFCASMADVFEDRPDLIEPRARLFDLIERTPDLDWLLLTKRPQNVAMLAPVRWGADPQRALFDDTTLMPRNVWMGTTVEDRERFRLRVPALRNIPAAVRFVSYEPALESLRGLFQPGDVDWVIVGGESGPGARPFDVDWAREIMGEECQRAGFSPFVKQLGARPFEVIRHEGGTDGRVLLADPKGGDWSEWPVDLRIRDFPSPRSVA